jgi:predicted ATP-grasp superfamily ATP-dependent carboligase
MSPQWVDEGAPVLQPGAIVLSSFPSAGLAATVAAHYIIRSLHLPRIGFVVPPEGSSVAIVQSGQVNPPIRVYGRADLAIVLSELPVPPELTVRLARMLLDGAEQRKARLLLGLEGIVPHPAADEPTVAEEAVWAAISRPEPKILELLKGAKVRLLDDAVIGGVSGALLVEALRRGMPVSVLLVSAGLAPEGFPDHRAGATLIETLDRLLPELQIDTGPLRTQAEMIERALRAAIKGRDKESQVPPPGPEQTIYG